MAIPPDGRQPRRSPDRPDPSRPSRATPDGADEARLAPAEQARIDSAVVRVGPGRGGAPVLVAALVVVAFLLGLVRPWDWLGGGSASATPAGGDAAGATARAVVDGSPGSGTDGGPATRGDGGAVPGTTPETLAPFASPTCGYPTSWRTAAISFWAGARARVWTAAAAVSATGPDDPSIPFHPIASNRVEAIGWCAPVSGPERPPLTAVGTLFRIRDGVAREVPVDRLEPAQRDALGELWVPEAQTVGRRPQWTAGLYVVRLATPSGFYARYLGLEVGVPEARPGPTGSGEPAAAAGSGSPSP